MQPRAFEYVRPATVSEAVRLLERHGDAAKVLAGGQSLIPLMKLRLAAPEVLVDIAHVRGLAGLREDGGELRIGAMTRDREFEESELVRMRYPILVDVVHGLGDPQVRNLGTIGGSLAHADPAGDWGTALLALDATVRATGPRGSRTVPLGEFFQDTFTTALAPSELLTEVRIPVPPPRSGAAYAKLKRKTGDFAIVSASAQLVLGEDGRIARARLALGAVNPVPLRAEGAEGSLVGKPADDAAFSEAGRLAAAECHPTADLHGSVDYKRAMVGVLAPRALRAAAERARGR